MAIVVAATQFIGYLLLAFDGAESSLNTSGGFVEWGRLSAPTHLSPASPRHPPPRTLTSVRWQSIFSSRLKKCTSRRAERHHGQALCGRRWAGPGRIRLAVPAGLQVQAGGNHRRTVGSGRRGDHRRPHHPDELPICGPGTRLHDEGLSRQWRLVLFAGRRRTPPTRPDPRSEFHHRHSGRRAGWPWVYHCAIPCQFIWSGPDSLTIGSRSFSGDTSVRLRYTFHEDRIIIGLVPPTNPTKRHRLWLGNCDVLQPSPHNGKQAASHLRVVADWFFFPHPIYRRDVLLQHRPRPR